MGTELERIPAKHIITNTKTSEWFGMDYNMNIYKGCCHGCIYCDSRSDCYRIDAFGFGVGIATKSNLIKRDIDVLSDIKEHSPVICKVTVTTADDALARKIEQGVCPSSERFEAVARLSEAGLYSGILLMPVLPFLEDSEENMLAIVKQAHEAGAKFIYALFGMTLRENQRAWYYEKLQELFPEENYVERYRQKYGTCYECRSPKSSRLWSRFVKECEKYGIRYEMKSIIRGYKQGYEYQQISLFDSPLFP